MGTLFDWSTTAGSNTSVDTINIAEGCPAGNVNNAMRSIMALVRNSFAAGLQTFLAGSSPLAIANGGTGATTAAAARAALGAAASSDIAGAVPAGTVIHVAMTSVPSGYLACNGAAVSRSTYSALFSAIGTVFGVGDGFSTFNLPDLRGEFIRGYDNGRGVDSGRVFGSAQSGAISDHNHQWYASSGGGGYRIDATNVGGGAATWNSAGAAYNIANDELYFDRYTSTAALNNSGDNRPRNIALLACVKY